MNSIPKRAKAQSTRKEKHGAAEPKPAERRLAQATSRPVRDLTQDAEAPLDIGAAEAETEATLQSEAAEREFQSLPPEILESDVPTGEAAEEYLGPSAPLGEQVTAPRRSRKEESPPVPPRQDVPAQG